MCVHIQRFVCVWIMKGRNMQVTYIGHSGFLLETEKAYFLFDYYKGNIPKLTGQKPIVVFVSHKHEDHYNPEIFALSKQYSQVKYVLDKDVPVKRQIEKYSEQGINLEERIYKVRKNSVTELALENDTLLQIQTLKSTDIGVAYLLTYEGKTYYHAGDLNLWVWEGEPEQANQQMEKAYFTELEKLKGKHIDVAFVPLDPRQENDAFSGMESFLAYTDSEIVFPMHFWKKPQIISDFLATHPEEQAKIKMVSEAGQVFDLEIKC